MKRSLFPFMFLTATVLFSLSACDEKETEDPYKPPVITPVDTNFKGIKLTNTGNITVAFYEYFGDSTLKLAPFTYQIVSGDTVKITELKYYISHVTFYTPSGVPYNSGKHNLFGFGNPNNSVSIPMPAGNYTRMSFLLGVDSVSNSSGAQEGDLDPGNGMFWSWSTGYIFYRIKARHSVSESAVSYDIGGLQNLVKVELDLKNYKVLKNSPRVEVIQDLGGFFNTPNSVNLKTAPAQIHTADHAYLATLLPNMSAMFRLKSIN